MHPPTPSASVAAVHAPPIHGSSSCTPNPWQQFMHTQSMAAVHAPPTPSASMAAVHALPNTLSICGSSSCTPNTLSIHGSSSCTPNQHPWQQFMHSQHPQHSWQQFMHLPTPSASVAAVHAPPYTLSIHGSSSCTSQHPHIPWQQFMHPQQIQQLQEWILCALKFVLAGASEVSSCNTWSSNDVLPCPFFMLP